MSTNQHRVCPDVPRRAWYAVAAPAEVGRAPLARRALGRRIVLYRTLDGQVVALEDRCAHRPVPLSLGSVVDDDIVAAYTGFRYGPDGRLADVPTQDNVPFGASVHAYPVREDAAFVWVWLGDPRLARLRPPQQLSWLDSPTWATFGETWETRASLELLHDNFADISHVPFVDTEIAPPALGEGSPPPLKVQVTETTVTFSRDFPPAPMAPWQAVLSRVPADSVHPHREEGAFLAPGLWVDRWDVTVEGHGDQDGVHTFMFSHALTPIDDTTTRHQWLVSRNFALHPANEGTLVPIFRRYYSRVREILEVMQTVIEEERPRPNVQVASDATGTQVRRIMERLVEEETGA